MKIALTDNTQVQKDILKELYEKYNIDQIEPFLDKLNKELRSFYTGKYSYGLCLSEKTKKIDDLKTIKKNTEKITLSVFEANDKLSKIKTKLETYLKDHLQLP